MQAELFDGLEDFRGNLNKPQKNLQQIKEQEENKKIEDEKQQKLEAEFQEEYKKAENATNLEKVIFPIKNPTEIIKKIENLQISLQKFTNIEKK